MLAPALTSGIRAAIRPGIGLVSGFSLAQRLLREATALIPDTYSGTGARINPITGATVPSGTALTVPGSVGGRPLTWRGCMGAATNLVAHSSDYQNAYWTRTDITATDADDGWDLITEGSAGTAELRNAGQLTITSGNRIWATLELRRGNHDWVRVIVVDNVLVCRFSTWVNLATGQIGTTSTAGAGASHGGAFLSRLSDGSGYLLQVSGTLGTVTQCNVRTYSTTADGVTTKVNNGTRYQRHATLTNGQVCTIAIPTAGATASITADSISLSRVPQFAAGSPLLAQPWCMILGVRLEGHSIGATGHVSGVGARLFDCPSTNVNQINYNVANQQINCGITDAGGVQSAVSALGAAPDAAGTNVVYAVRWIPSVSLTVFRNGIQIAQDLTVGATMPAWTQALYLGNLAALNRAITGWVTDPFLITGRVVPDPEILAMSNTALWRMVA